jgi:hypothetical protein
VRSVTGDVSAVDPEVSVWIAEGNVAHTPRTVALYDVSMAQTVAGVQA